MTTHTNSSIQSTVMRRVYIIHALSPLLTMTAFAAVAALVAGWGIGREVWVAHVLQNMPSLSNLGAVMNFYLAAFMNTRFIVQALAVTIVGSFIWLAVSAAKTITTLVRFA